MRETTLPDIDAPLANRSLAACLAAILECPVADVPCRSNGSPFTEIGWWLATRNLALVPVRDPEGFEWAGWWIARMALDSVTVAEPFVVMAGTPSDIVWAPAGTGAPPDAEVAEGWVIAHPALAHPSAERRGHGVVERLFRAPVSGASTEELAEAVLIAGVGIEGDRYAVGDGHFSGPGRWGQALTLIEAEAIEALAAEQGVALAPGDARRNIVARGIDLNSLVGKRFRVGEALCFGQRLAEPCSWLQRTTPAGTLRGLVHRGGLRADILEGATVRPGDAITPEPAFAKPGISAG